MWSRGETAFNRRGEVRAILGAWLTPDDIRDEFRLDEEVLKPGRGVEVAPHLLELRSGDRARLRTLGGQVAYICGSVALYAGGPQGMPSHVLGHPSLILRSG